MLGMISELLPWSIGIIVCIIAALCLTAQAIHRRRMRLLWYATSFFGFALVLVLVVAVRTGRAVYHELKVSLAPRSGEMIYNDLFGAPTTACVTITRHRDQVIPKLDTSIRLRVRTCPAELRRILGQAAYSSKKERTTRQNDTDENGFEPSSLGDTVWVHMTERIPGRNWRWIYCNMDSTEAIVEDVLD